MRPTTSQIGLLLSIVLLLMFLNAGVAAAQEVCSPLVAEALQVVGAGCSETGRNEACYGNTQVSVAFQEGITPAAFSDSGDLVSLPELQSLITEPFEDASGDWGIAVLRLLTAFPEETSLTMVLFGDTELNNAGEMDSDNRTCPAQIIDDLLSTSLYTQPDFSSASNYTYSSSYSAVGRSADGEWLYLEGDTDYDIGWLPLEEAELSCSPDLLSIIDSESLAAAPQLQAFTLENGSAETCAEAPNGLMVSAPAGTRGSLTVNAVRLDFASSAFLNAVRDSNLTINGLEGAVDVTSFGQTVTVYPGFLTTVPLTGLAASGPPTTPQAIQDLHNAPPLLDTVVNAEPYEPNPSPLPIDAPLFEPPTNEVLAGRAAAVNVSLDIAAPDCPVQTAPQTQDVVLVLDTSGSMEGAPLASAKGAVQQFFDQLDPTLDQIALVTFNSFAAIEVPLGQDFEGVRRAVVPLEARGGTAIDSGLAMAQRVLRDKRPGSIPIVVLFSDGISNPNAALQVANSLKLEGTRIISIGLGAVDSALMNGIATSPDEAFITQDVDALSDTFVEATNQFAGLLAARNLTIQYRVDSEHYDLIADYLPNGDIIAPGVIQWNLALLWDAETLNLPFYVRPLGAGTFPVGTLEYAYFDCEGTLIVAGPTPTGSIAAVDTLADSTISSDQVMSIGLQGVGTVEGGLPTYWLVDVQSEAPFTLEIQSQGGTPLAVFMQPANYQAATDLSTALLFGDGSVDSLADPTISEAGGSLYTFNDLEPGLYLAGIFANTPDAPTAPLPFTFLMDNLNSFEPEIDGTLTLDAPVQEINVPAPPFDPNGDGTIESILLLEGVTGDLVTLTNYEGYGVTIISSDAFEAEWLTRAYDYVSTPERTVYQLHGTAPYYLKVETYQTSLQIDNGDTVSVDAGSIQVGETVSGATERLFILTYMLEVTEPQTVTVRLLSDAGMIDFYTYRDNLVWLANINSAENKIGAAEISQPGTYALEITVLGDYTLSFEEGNGLVAPVQAIELDSTVEGDTGTEVQVVEYLLDAPEGELVTLRLHHSPTPRTIGSNHIDISDANGDILYRNYDLLERQVGANGASIFVHVLPLVGPPPYTVSFGVQGPYSFSVETGDTLAVDMGSLAIGQSVGIETPGSVSAFADYNLLDVETGADLLIVEDVSQTDTNGDTLNPLLVSADHRLTEVVSFSESGFEYFEGQAWTHLAALGEAPYHLSFDYSDINGGIRVVFTVIDLNATIPVTLTIDSNNLSRSPGGSSGSVRVITSDQPLEAISRSADGGWIMILTEDRAFGWVAASTVTPVDASIDLATLPINPYDGSITLLPFPEDQTTCMALYNEGVNSRSGPGEQYPLVAQNPSTRSNDTVIARALTGGEWYLLGSGVWINHGVVYEEWNNCSALPQVTLSPEGDIVLVDSPLSTPSVPDESDTNTDDGETTVEGEAAPSSVSACIVLANADTNRRSGPATTFESPGKLTEAQTVTGQTVAADGTWYQLADESWVRSDVVATQGDCTALPNI